MTRLIDNNKVVEISIREWDEESSQLIKGCSFMNYYCVRSLLEMGYSYYDFVECYVDFDEIVHMFPIGYTWDNMVSFGNNVNMVFLGYSRRH